MPSFINRVVRFLLRLVLWTFAAIFAVSLLLASLILVVLGLLRSLFTGQKPNPVVLGRFQRFATQPPWPGTRARAAAPTRGGDVVDVEVREIRDDQPRS